MGLVGDTNNRSIEMPAYWVTFKDRPAGCVEAQDETSALVAARIATRNNPVKAEILPYPANPRLVKKEYTDPKGHKYNCPSFCYKPEQCKGRTCCPQRYSCTE
jgi:hypothetical protein